jgi:MFS superfamily sulfate permease-like transporter
MFREYRREIMNKLIAGLASGLAAFQTTAAFANVSEGPPDYSGITGLYYTLIAVVLAYGVYDTFFSKN